MAYKEDELVAGCLQGKNSHQQALYSKYAGKMMGICLRYLKEREEAEDAFQDSFIKVFNSLKSYKGPNLDAWIKRIFINSCINCYHKNKQKIKHVEYEDVSEINFAMDDFLTSISNEDLLKVIDIIPEGYRMVFNLYVIEGYNHKEIGVMLNINEGTSKSQLSKARKLLQKKLINLYPNVYENR
ncbi:MAG: sigma-70 family RNA polymerase sigma factor [Bacteroidota bacterium]|nr:sigma-70 family RNA polymerase sigma factor [Bacteroidota bacterium]